MDEKTLTIPNQQPVERSVWSTASANDLPDSAFAYIEDGGTKDEEGKTKPRSLRHLPYKNADGKVDPAHVRNALARLSQTQIPESAKASARRKLVAAAKSVGIEVSDDDDNKERSMTSTHTHTHDTLTRAANHEPMTGKHSHPHPTMGSQGDDDSHDHDHDHDGDNDHDHDHGDRALTSSPVHSLYAPIVRTDAKDWIIEGQVTSDQVDHYGTIFDYEASKKAFQDWRGNIREQHDSKKAVGRAIEVIPDDATRTIFLRAKISKGARDTWEKILDGTLSGFSVGADPRQVESSTIVRDGKSIPVYHVKKWAEVSVVDNPGSPGCDLVPLVRADGFVTDVVDCSEETPALAPESSSLLSRAGARVSSDTRDAMHTGIAHTIKAAVSQMKNCNCDACQAAMQIIDPDNDGDIDLGGYDDPDQDWQSLYGDGGKDMDRALSGMIERILEKQLTTVYARLQGIAGALSRANAAPTTSLDTLISGAIERAVTAANEANDSSFAEVRASLGAVKEQVDAIANTPMPGAPIQHASSLPRPVEKQLATSPQPSASQGALYDAMRTQFARNAQTGSYRSLDDQIQDMAAVLAVQPPIRR